MLEQAVSAAQAGANSLAVLRALSMLAAIAVDAGDLADADSGSPAPTPAGAQKLGEYWMGALAGRAGHLADGAGDLERARNAFERAAYWRSAACPPISSTR